MNPVTQVGEKEVLLSLPFNPASHEIGEFVGREDEIREVMAAWMMGVDIRPQAPLLVGENGTGKNRLVYELARLLGKNLYVETGRQSFKDEELVCVLRPKDRPVKNSEWVIPVDYVLSQLATAMLKGQIFFLDEIGSLCERDQNLLISLLDERRYIDSTYLGERIYAQPGFLFIAATNRSDLDRGAMSPKIMARLAPIIDIGYPSEKEINEMIHKRGYLPSDGDEELMDLFWKLWRENNGDRPASPRHVIEFFRNIMGRAGLDNCFKNSPGVKRRNCNFKIVSLETLAGRITTRHVEAAFPKFFGEKSKGSLKLFFL